MMEPTRDSSTLLERNPVTALWRVSVHEVNEEKTDADQSGEIGRLESVFEHRISRIHSGVYDG